MSDHEKRIDGFVRVFYHDKYYGFLSETENGQGIHFNPRYAREDWKGCKCWLFVTGTPVRFGTEQNPSKKFPGVLWTSAIDIEPVFVDEDHESLETYSETSQVNMWNGRFGELRRECGDELFFHKDSIAAGFEYLLHNLQIGDFVYHRVGQRADRDNGSSWHAVDIEIFSEAEQDRLRRGLPAQEPEVAPVATAPDPESVLVSSARGKTLFELVAERRTKHGSH
jgi:hypothetical protein